MRAGLDGATGRPCGPEFCPLIDKDRPPFPGHHAYPKPDGGDGVAGERQHGVKESRPQPMAGQVRPQAESNVEGMVIFVGVSGMPFWHLRCRAKAAEADQHAARIGRL